MPGRGLDEGIPVESMSRQPRTSKDSMDPNMPRMSGGSTGFQDLHSMIAATIDEFNELAAAHRKKLRLCLARASLYMAESQPLGLPGTLVPPMPPLRSEVDDMAKQMTPAILGENDVERLDVTGSAAITEVFSMISEDFGDKQQYSKLENKWIGPDDDRLGTPLGTLRQTSKGSDKAASSASLGQTSSAQPSRPTRLTGSFHRMQQPPNESERNRWKARGSGSATTDQFDVSLKKVYAQRTPWLKKGSKSGTCEDPDCVPAGPQKGKVRRKSRKTVVIGKSRTQSTTSAISEYVLQQSATQETDEEEGGWFADRMPGWLPRRNSWLPYRLSRGITDILANKKQRPQSQTQQIYDDLALHMSKMRINKQDLRSETPRVRIENYLQSESFDLLICFILVINAGYIGYETDYNAKLSSKTESTPIAMQVIGIVFCVIFVCELVLRLTFEGPNFFTKPGCSRNWFDAGIVLFTVADEGSQVIDHLVGTTGQGSLGKAGALRMMRLARIGRLVRLVHLSPALFSMVSLILASMHSFLWTCCLIMIMMTCFAIIFTELANQSRDSPEMIDQNKLAEHWGNVATSVYSLFMAITGGDDWRHFVDVYRGHGYFLPVTLGFSFYIAFGMLVMLNLVTGVFVEGAQRIIREDKQKAKIATAAEIFIEVGMEHDATLNKMDFIELLHGCPLFAEFLIDLGIEASEAETLFTMFDRDGSGDVSLAEFLTSCLTMGKPATSGELYSLRYEQRMREDVNVRKATDGDEERFDAIRMFMRQELNKVVGLLLDPHNLSLEKNQQMKCLPALNGFTPPCSDSYPAIDEITV